MKKKQCYLKYSELKEIYDTCVDSIIVVYQHIPHIERRAFFNQLSTKIKTELNTSDIMCLSDSGIVFCIMSKNKMLINETHSILAQYATENELLFERH